MMENKMLTPQWATGERAALTGAAPGRPRTAEQRAQAALAEVAAVLRELRRAPTRPRAPTPPAPDPEAAELARLRDEVARPYRFLEIEPLGAGVPRSVRQAATATAKACAADLGLRNVPRVAWFVEHSAARAAQPGTLGEFRAAAPCRGLFRAEAPSAVYLHMGIDSERDAVEIASHELRHKWQLAERGLPASDAERAEREADAEAYAAAALAAYDRGEFG
jgi:hypothetical protein